ncbi:hypothetical protein K7I13_14110 [Brucepastera parasyntrophica]|uniref:hypothetical protein n=1 Tax=Brucepastera parasyntrophica TaxID=2880008 RepID=UPI00210916B0|nr:hypothetical protein [Brucepastera parasyntrophica]ULQ59580.1 hypothetical protein K7I13_14110 [Brucepastera parasyntrophica]
MKTDKKLPILFFLILLMGIPVFAIDYGFELSNKGGIRIRDDADFFSEHRATAWMTIPFDINNRNSLALEGSVYTTKKEEGGYTFYLDLDFLRFSFNPVNTDRLTFHIDAGRLPVRDATGILLNQSVDGADFRMSMPFGNMALFAGYTGLLNARKTGALMTADDYADYVSDKIYALGAQRIIGKFTLHIPELAGSTDLIIEILGQYDMRDIIQSDYSELVNTIYGTISLTGAITNSLYYTLTGGVQGGILDTKTEQYSEIAALGLANLMFFPVINNQFFLEFLYTTAPNKVLTTLLPITFQNAGTIYSMGYENLMKATLGWIFTPFSFLNFDVDAKLFMYPGKQDNVESLYIGTEVNAGVTWEVFSDLRVRFEAGIFLPNEEKIQTLLSLKAIFAL